MVEAMKALLLKERQEKLQLEMHLRDEICNEMVEQMQQREQWCRYQLSNPSCSVTYIRRWEVGLGQSSGSKSALQDHSSESSLLFSPLLVNIWTPKRNYWRRCMKRNSQSSRSH